MTVGFEIREMVIADYGEVAALWERTEGVGLDDDADSRENMESYLVRNPGMSFVARLDGRVVGAVLCGHDGRRGYLHHLAVSPSVRRQGVGRALVDKCISALREAGINKCNIMVFDDNEEGLAFWQRTGWAGRQDLILLQKWTSEE